MVNMTNRIVKKRDVVDILNEARLIREFSIYGCEEKPGKVFGYNPFSDKCVDITGYTGPEAPYVSPGTEPGPEKPKDGQKIGDTLSTVGGALGFLKRVYLEAFDYDEILECIENNTAFSILGPIFGKTMVKILPKLVIWGTKKTYEVTTDSGRKKVELDNYIEQKRLKNRTFMGKWGSRAAEAADLYAKVLMSYKKLTFLGFGALGYGIANYGFAGETGKEFVDWVDRKTVGEESDAAWKCFFASAVLAVTAGLIIRGGAKGILALTKKAGGSVKNAVIEIGKTDAFRNLIGESLDAAIKKVNSKDLLIFKVLQETGQAPKNLKIVIDKGPNSVGLKLEGVSDFTDVVKIPVDEAPEALKQYAVDGKVILDPKKLSQDLTNISQEVNKTVHKLSDTNAAGMRDSDLYKRLKALRDAAKKFGAASPSTARAAAFENSSKIIIDLSARVEDSLKVLDEIHTSILKDDITVRNIINKLEDAGEVINFDSLRNKILKAEPGEVNKILNESLPGMSNDAPKNFAMVEEYFKNTKDFDVLQKTTITDIELSRIALLEETGVVKNLFPGGKNEDVLTSWLNSQSGKKYKSTWDEMPGFSQRMGKYIQGRYFSGGLIRAVNEIFDNAAFIGAYIGGAMLLADIIWGERKEVPIDEKEKKEILRIASEVMKDIRLEYYIKDDKVKAKELLLAVLGSKKFTKSTLKKRTIQAIEKVRKNLESDTKSIEIIDKHINRNEDTLPNKLALSRRVQDILFTIFSPRQEKQDKQDKGKKNKKTETNLMSQIPEGDLKKKSPFSLNVNGVKTEVKFTNDYIQMGKKRFKFNHSTAGDAKIDKVFSEKKNNVLKTQLSVNFFGKRIEKYNLTEQDLQDLFLTMSKMNVGDPKQVSLGGKTGNIIRMKDLNEVKIMNKKSLKELVTKVLNENYGQGYGQYPYSSDQIDEEEPREDYAEEWKALELDVVQDKTRKVAIEIAKILVRDLELFNDVLDLAGQNQSVGTEILSKLKEARENKNT